MNVKLGKFKVFVLYDTNNIFNKCINGQSSYLLILSFSVSSSEESKSLSKRQVDTHTRRVVCYYANWSVYRQGTAKFTPQNINPYLCTHLIYAFGGLGKDDSIQTFDKYQDLEKGMSLDVVQFVCCHSVTDIASYL